MQAQTTLLLNAFIGGGGIKMSEMCSVTNITALFENHRLPKKTTRVEIMFGTIQIELSVYPTIFFDAAHYL